MVEVQKNTIRLVNELNDPIFSRQKAPKIYDLNASVYIYSRDFLLSDKKMFSENQGLYVMPQERSCDIDTLEDLEFVKYKLKKVSNKNIVVVGGNGLIGSSVVSSLKNENKVFNIDITNQNKHEYLDEVYKYKGDVLEIDSIKKIFSDIEKDHGGIHAVVNCTHFKRISRGKDHSSISESEFNESTQQLLTSVFLISQLSINHFLRNGGGNLINLGSIQGVQISKFWHYEGTDMSSPLEYSIAKSSIITMTRYLAKFHKGKNIRINCISPGGILDNQPKEFLEKYRMSTTNIGMLNPSDVSNAIKWLVSDQSRAVNGQNIIVDDGWSL